MRTADIGFIGYTQAEVERAARELEFGKGQHEMPYFGRDENPDPIIHGGFPTGTRAIEDSADCEDDAQEDPPTSMDRFRSKARNRKRKTRKGDEQ